jgi:hypothetical protein
VDLKINENLFALLDTVWFVGKCPQKSHFWPESGLEYSKQVQPSSSHFPRSVPWESFIFLSFTKINELKIGLRSQITRKHAKLRKIKIAARRNTTIFGIESNYIDQFNLYYI